MHSATKIIIYKLTNLKCNSDCWSLGLTTMYSESDETFARHDHGVAWPKLSLSRLFYSLGPIVWTQLKSWVYLTQWVE